MHFAVARRITDSGALDSCAVVVVVPTRGAADALQRTLDPLLPQPVATAGPAVRLVTRDELYECLHEQWPDAPPRLSGFEREVVFRRAARTASEGGVPAPFALRPGLIAEILAFYDELRRRDRTVDDFTRLMTDSLQDAAAIDRGAERMLRQTRFLTAAFTEFERLVQASGLIDEHGLRQHLLTDEHRCAPSHEPRAIRHVVLTVADQAADARGLWTADYDLLTRLPGLDRIDVIATENVLATGFHQRIHDLLPGIEEERIGAPAQPPQLITPDDTGLDRPNRWFVCRDREEELADVARRIRSAASGADSGDRMAVVFQRPLPYLYLARQVFAEAEMPFRASDTLPLASEPFAAALDLVFAFIVTEANRASIADLLGSPHWRFTGLPDDILGVKQHVADLDASLREIKYLGGWDRLARLTGEDDARWRRARVGLLAATSAANALESVRSAGTASRQIRAVLEFVRAHERLPADDGVVPRARHLRARAAVLDALESLAESHARHDDAPLTPEQLASAVRRWIEAQTFSPVDSPVESRGVMLFDAPAAAYADVDELRLVGLVESDWPERAGNNIFYPASLLGQLGWPNPRDRLAAARARFQDLLRLARRSVSVSSFTLEDDAIVSPSSLLEELETSGLPVERSRRGDVSAVFVHETLMDSPGSHPALDETAGEWLALRQSRSPAEDDAFHGAAGPRPAGVYAVSHVERYLACPFKYFAANVLRLAEEREDESGLSPMERGQLLHEVFEQFFKAWHGRGRKGITAANLDDALELFESVTEQTLARLPDADRALERTYLLGSAAASGLAERAFTFEIEQGDAILERLLEHPLEGEFEFAGADGPRRVRIKAKADRIDLLDDGSLRVIDYKLGRAPKSSRSLQLPIYGVCAEQHLEGRHGRSWRLSRAGYVAFKEKNAFVPLGGSTSLDQALIEGQQRLVAALDGIERGEFPPRPEEPFTCNWCSYAAVCRKDYVGDE